MLFLFLLLLYVPLLLLLYCSRQGWGMMRGMGASGLGWTVEPTDLEYWPRPARTQPWLPGCCWGGRAARVPGLRRRAPRSLERGWRQRQGTLGSVPSRDDGGARTERSLDQMLRDARERRRRCGQVVLADVARRPCARAGGLLRRAGVVEYERGSADRLACVVPRKRAGDAGETGRVAATKLCVCVRV